MRTGHWALGFWLVWMSWVDFGPPVAVGGPVRTLVADAGVRPGIDVLLSDSLHLVRGRRVGLVTNQSGVDQAGVSDVDRLRGAGVALVALFSPEHGFRGSADPGEAVASSTDCATGLPIYSLYGKTSAPTDSMLAGIRRAARRPAGRRRALLHLPLDHRRGDARRRPEGDPVVVLDRPNPIGGAVQGNVLDTAFRVPGRSAGHPDAARHDARRAGPPRARRPRTRRGSPGRAGGGVAARRCTSTTPDSPSCRRQPNLRALKR